MSQLIQRLERSGRHLTYYTTLVFRGFGHLGPYLLFPFEEQECVTVWLLLTWVLMNLWTRLKGEVAFMERYGHAVTIATNSFISYEASSPTLKMPDNCQYSLLLQNNALLKRLHLEVQRDSSRSIVTFKAEWFGPHGELGTGVKWFWGPSFNQLQWSTVIYCELVFS